MAEVELNLTPWLDRASRKKCHEDERARTEATRLASWAGRQGHADPRGRESTPARRTCAVIWPRPRRGAATTAEGWVGHTRVTGVAPFQALSSCALRVTRAHSGELRRAPSQREMGETSASFRVEAPATWGCLTPKSPESPIEIRVAAATKPNEPLRAEAQVLWVRRATRSAVTARKQNRGEVKAAAPNDAHRAGTALLKSPAPISRRRRLRPSATEPMTRPGTTSPVRQKLQLVPAIGWTGCRPKPASRRGP